MTDTSTSTDEAEETTEETTGTEEATDTAAETDPLTAAQAEIDKWKAMSRKHEADAKKFRPAADKLAEIEQANQTEAEKAATRATAAEERATKAETELIRTRVAADKGLPAELRDRLRGTTEEEMAEDADRLLEVMKPARQQSGSADGGARGKTRPGQLGEDFVTANKNNPEAIEAARQAGQLNEYLGITP